MHKSTGATLSTRWVVPSWATYLASVPIMVRSVVAHAHRTRHCGLPRPSPLCLLTPGIALTVMAQEAVAVRQSTPVISTAPRPLVATLPASTPADTAVATTPVVASPKQIDDVTNPLYAHSTPATMTTTTTAGVGSSTANVDLDHAATFDSVRVGVEPAAVESDVHGTATAQDIGHGASTHGDSHDDAAIAAQTGALTWPKQFMSSFKVRVRVCVL